LADVFEFADYRQFLREKRHENRQLRGYQTRMAEAAGCQRAYLSQVMNGHVQLTPDHAMGLADLFELNQDEREYLLDLVNLERARTKRLKDWFSSRLKDQLRARETLSRRLQVKEEIPNQHEAQYYSKWYVSAIHILVGIPHFSSVKDIAAKLDLTPQIVSSALGMLKNMGLVDVDSTGKRWHRSKRNLHVAQSKTMNVVNHLNWRHKVISDIQQEHEKSLHYTAIHSLSKKDLEALRACFVDAIAKSRAIVEPSLDEELICVACDVFTIGKQ